MSNNPIAAPTHSANRFLGKRLQCSWPVRRARCADTGRLTHDLCKRPECDAVSVGEAASAEWPNLFSRAGKEFRRNGICQRRRCQAPSRGRAHRSSPPERIHRLGKLSIPSDHRRSIRRATPSSDRPTRACTRAPARPSPQLEGLKRLYLDGVAHKPIGGLADQDLEGRRRLPKTESRRFTERPVDQTLSATPATTSPVLTPGRALQAHAQSLRQGACSAPRAASSSPTPLTARARVILWRVAGARTPP